MNNKGKRIGWLNAHGQVADLFPLLCVEDLDRVAQARSAQDLVLHGEVEGFLVKEVLGIC